MYIRIFRFFSNNDWPPSRQWHYKDGQLEMTWTRSIYSLHLYNLQVSVWTLCRLTNFTIHVKYVFCSYYNLKYLVQITIQRIIILNEDKIYEPRHPFQLVFLNGWIEMGMQSKSQTLLCKEFTLIAIAQLECPS